MSLTAERNTKVMLDVERSPFSWPVKGGVKIWKGSLVVLNAGFAAPGTSASSLTAVGRCEKTIDNTAGADGAVQVSVRPGVFKWANSGTNAVLAANVGGVLYVEDDQTVGISGVTKSPAGRCMQLDSDGVWVKTDIGVTS